MVEFVAIPLQIQDFLERRDAAIAAGIESTFPWGGREYRISRISRPARGESDLAVALIGRFSSEPQLDPDDAATGEPEAAAPERSAAR